MFLCAYELHMQLWHGQPNVLDRPVTQTRKPVAAAAAAFHNIGSELLLDIPLPWTIALNGTIKMTKTGELGR